VRYFLDVVPKRKPSSISFDGMRIEHQWLCESDFQKLLESVLTFKVDLTTPPALLTYMEACWPRAQLVYIPQQNV
jgi:hypothetical protein